MLRGAEHPDGAAGGKPRALHLQQRRAARHQRRLRPLAWLSEQHVTATRQDRMFILENVLNTKIEQISTISELDELTSRTYLEL